MEPNQTLQIAGAVVLLAAYVALQSHVLSSRSLTFSAMNVVGAGLLAWEAWRTYQYGFLLLEGTWTLISLVAGGYLLLDRLRRERVPVSSAPDAPIEEPAREVSQ